MDRFTTKENPKAELIGCVYCMEHSNCYSNMSCDEIYNALSKLRYYEDLEEQDRLIILPCKIEDTLYITEPRFYNYEKHEGIQRGVCKSYELDDRYGWVIKVALDEGEPHTLYFYNFSKFGKSVFLTREEAEAALNNA